MNKTSIIVLIILLVIIASSIIYFLIKKKKETEERENNAEENKDILEEPELDNANTERKTETENRSCANLADTEPFTADEVIVIDPNQSRTTEEYITWQKENKESITVE